ncbi:MAG TPA: hypothetical protein PLX06_02520 [Fimbriimonadaceae bacterium]|nr:hypothetical protein [Fimbriimonadaceae bacterium]
MLRRKLNQTVPLRALVRAWERATNDRKVEAAAAQTAAVLSRVHDVPADVLEALDSLLSGDWEGQGRAIYTVVGYLRNLQDLDRLAGVSD